MGLEISKRQGELLEAVDLLRVAILTSRGDPYLVPVRFHFDGEAFYFVSPTSSEQLLHLRANRRLGLVADRMKGPGLEGVIVQGLAQFVRGQAEQDRVLSALRERYPKHPFVGSLVKVVPTSVYDLSDDES